MHRIFIICVVAFMLCGVTLADETKSTSKTESGSKVSAAAGVSETAQVEKETTKTKVKRKKLVHRLPNHFKSVVTEEQKAKIYEIQDEYADVIAEYREKLAKALKERNAKINAVLTPEQTAKVEQLRKEAKAKRKAKAEDKAENKAEK